MKNCVFTTVLMFFGSMLTSAQKNYNIYPNYKPGVESVIKYILKSGTGISRKEISPIFPLEVNGEVRQGTVKSKWPDRNEANIDLYEIKVEKEGLLSIVAKPVSYDNKRGTLVLDVFGNDDRMDGGTILRRLARKSNNSYRRDDGWNIVDSYSFYAYPGTYYLKVDGKYGDEKGKSDYIPLIYQVGVIQDDNVNSYSGNLGKDIGPYYPKDLGTTALNNGGISIVSSLHLENWVSRSKDGLLARKSAYTNVNTRDQFKFTANKSGKVHFNFTAFTSEAMDVWSRAWRKVSSNDKGELPLFTIQVLLKNVSNNTIMQKQSSFDGSIDVVAGKEYIVYISSYKNRPAYYRLDLSYTKKESD
ncbi:MAG: hypothetical protein GY810_21105 [Aureispira sp.]|nr:hypothetical protein [Aureispira sp.]